MLALSRNTTQDGRRSFEIVQLTFKTQPTNRLRNYRTDGTSDRVHALLICSQLEGEASLNGAIRVEGSVVVFELTDL